MFKQLPSKFTFMSMKIPRDTWAGILYSPNPSKKLVKMNKRKHFQAPESQWKRTGLFLLVKTESDEWEVKWGFIVIKIVDAISTTVKREKRM